MSARPFFSVIIPTRHRPERLARCLDAMCRLDFPRQDFEILVVNDDAADARPEAMIASYKNRLDLQLLAQPRAGPSAARNAGLACARGIYAVFTGDDCAPAEDWLRVLAEHFADSPAAGVGGTILNARPENLCASTTHMLLDHLCAAFNSTPRDARFFTPNNFAFPADALREIGGFHPALRTGEDRELCDRWRVSGRELHCAPRAVVRHDHPLTFSFFCRQHFSYGRGSARYRRVTCRELARARDFEPVSFYVKLLLRPLSAGRVTPRAFLKIALLAVSQAANAAGFLHEWHRTRRAEIRC